MVSEFGGTPIYPVRFLNCLVDDGYQGYQVLEK